jgi:DNA invertase Pin-like site-specific DNA recombinase
MKGETRRCSVCEEDLPLSAFRCAGGRHRGLRRDCIECEHEARRAKRRALRGMPIDTPPLTPAERGSLGGRASLAKHPHLKHNIRGPKLTPEQREEIRVLALSGALTQTEIGRRYGVTQTHVWRLMNGRMR